MDELWHKSDGGMVQFQKYSEKSLIDFFNKGKGQFKERFKGVLVVKKVPFEKRDNLPSEIFLSIKYEDSYGPVARLGFGGVHTEMWAEKHPPIEIYLGRSLNEVLEELSFHLLGKMWLGLLRQEPPMLPVQEVKAIVKNIFRMLLDFQDQYLGLKKSELSFDLIEINPLVIVDDKLVAIDGVGVKKESSFKYMNKRLEKDSLLSPFKIAIAGVSSKKENFGNLIFSNLKKSKIEKEDLLVIKPGTEEFQGVKCVQSLAELKCSPVDHLILALPPSACYDSIVKLCEQNGGAEFLFLVAGGIGDGADKEGIGKKLEGFLLDRLEKNMWIPRIIGPNSLGTILSSISLNTLFIPDEKLPISFNSKGKMAFISQSGAFFITRLSQMESLPLKYAFCIGNQLDLSFSELVDVLLQDSAIEVISLYVEGFKTYDLYFLAESIKRASLKGKKIIVYKAGRSEKGSIAAAGHTGAMPGTYQFEMKVLKNSGAIVCASISDFNFINLFYSKIEKQFSLKKVGVITNAGFESVVSADILENSIFSFSDTLNQRIEQILKDQHLNSLVSSSNPMDLTPMASESCFIDISREVLTEADLLAVSFVPLTNMIETSIIEKAESFASQLSVISKEFQKPLFVIVDSGALYDKYRSCFEKKGLTVFSSMEQASRSILSILG